MREVKKDYLYLDCEIFIGEDIRNRVLKNILKPKKHDTYCCFFYLKNNFPKVDIFVMGRASDVFFDNNIKRDMKAVDIFKRKKSRRLNMQEIKYLYALNLMAHPFDVTDESGLLYQIIYPKKEYVSNCSVNGEGWLFKTLENEKEYKKYLKVWKSKKMSEAIDKYYNYYFKKMIRKIVYCKKPNKKKQKKVKK